MSLNDRNASARHSLVPNNDLSLMLKKMIASSMFLCSAVSSLGRRRVQECFHYSLIDQINVRMTNLQFKPFLVQWKMRVVFHFRFQVLILGKNFFGYETDFDERITFSIACVADWYEILSVEDLQLECVVEEIAADRQQAIRMKW